MSKRNSNHGGVDLSGSVYSRYKQTYREAQKLTRAGRFAQAAAKERQCAELYRQYAGYARDTATSKQRADIASRHSANAAALEKKATAQGQRANREIGDKTVSKRAQGATEEAGQFRQQALDLITSVPVDWDDIGGLANTKREIKTAYGLALAQKPAGVELSSLRNMLFYGPPGTGKTLLAAATSNGLQATFFSVKVSDLLSKYFGESTKLVSALYEVAREMSPAVVFLDEFESITPARGGGDSGAERRLVSTLLAELDGLAGKGSDAYVLTIAATNLPWLIDKAILSRFEKKVYIPLPDADAREAILDIQLAKRGLQSVLSASELVAKTDGFSGREIERLCKEAMSRMTQRANPGLIDAVEKGGDAVRKYELNVEPISEADFGQALAVVKPETTQKDVNRYQTWVETRE